MKRDVEKIIPPESFEQVFSVYFSDIYNFLNVLCRDFSEAEELCQEAFFRFYKKYGNDNYSALLNIKALLLTIAKNLYLNRLKKEKRTLQGADTFLQNTADNRVSHTESTEWRLYYEDVARKLSMEKKIYSVIFVLKVGHGYSFREIAKICGKTTRTIRRHLIRIREITGKY